jgi:hypothetical protein
MVQRKEGTALANLACMFGVSWSEWSRSRVFNLTLSIVSGPECPSPASDETHLNNCDTTALQ